MAEPRERAKKTKGGDELVFLALGGLGEIGMNVYLYGWGPANARQWLMVDLGITFPHEEEPGVDVVLPDLRFIAEDNRNLAGIVLTHAHEDHIGAVIDLWPALNAPIYASPFTAGMLKSKLAEFGGRLKLPITEVPLGSRFAVGPFDVELVTMAHSIPEPSALAIRAGGKLVLHTGDWKLDATPLVGDPADEAKLQALGAEGVDVLVCDSTNAFRDGRSPSEVDVARSLAGIIKKASGRVVVTSFASNVARIKAVADAARASGRKLIVSGRALHRVIGVAIETGYLPQGFQYYDQDAFAEFDREEVLCLCTGSQGEPRAALARISENEHPAISLARGDLVVFSSRAIPGNEKVLARIQNNLVRMGVEVLTDTQALVHVTGHPRRDELRQMYAWTRPKIAVPMHGQALHIAEHARIAREAGVPSVVTAYDGDIVRLAPEPAAVIDDAPVGRLFRDGRLIVPSVEGPVRERRKLSFVGIVVVAIPVSRRGEVLGEAQVTMHGVPHETADGGSMLDVILDAVEGTLDSIPVARRKDPDALKDSIARAVRAAVGEAWGKKPFCQILITTLDARS